MTETSPFRIFVIGASAGGHSAVKKVLQYVPPTINASFMVVMHSAFDMPSKYASYLKTKIKLKVVEARDDQAILPGTVYIGQPNFHLFIKKDFVKLSNGPRENLFRPAIDVLFRSAAVAYQNSCVGILLTGRLNDGCVGLESIKKCGGLALIQNPKTAEFGDMPSNAQKNVDIDYVVDVDDMSEVIQKIMLEPLPKKKPVSPGLRKENEIATRIKSQITLEDKLGHQVPISCSSCGGPLWEMENTKTKRYRCHVGHAFTQEALLQSQNESLEQALWISVRTLEEKRMLLERMANDYAKRNAKALAKSYKSKVDEVNEQIYNLRNVLQIAD